MDQNAFDIEFLTKRLQTEYEEWQRHRKRWKSDFKDAYDNTQRINDALRAEVSSCNNQADQNQRAIKMILDASMIQHLI